MAEVVAAVCAFALGRPVKYYPPMFPADDAKAQSDAHEEKVDLRIPGLARENVSLDIFGNLVELGDFDALFRVRGALLAYHAALQQASPDVAVMLLVTCIEALISPRFEWGKSKVTTRFIKSLISLCPDVVDEIVDHPNVEEAFSYKRRGGRARQRREILDAVYTSRSLPTHAGLNLSSSGMMTALSDPGGFRIALVSTLARSAVLNYLRAPRSSIVGQSDLSAEPPVPKWTRIVSYLASVRARTAAVSSASI
jgi:hypothetical protein